MRTRIRIQEGTSLTEKLSLIIKDDELEIFSPEANFLESFKRRAASLQEAFYFLLQAHPPQVFQFLLPFINIDNYLQAHAINFEGKETFEAQQKELERYVERLVALIGACWYGESVSAVDLLNDAECYLLLQKGRQDLITIAWHEGLKAYVLQEERALPAYNMALLDELGAIKKQVDENAFLPEQWPLWFSALARYKQNFIFYLLKELKPEEPIETIVFFIPSRHRDLPALSNWAKHRLRLINAEGAILFESDWKYRSSHIVPRTLFHEGRLSTSVRQEILQRHLEANLQQIKSAVLERGLLIQTLISPLQGLPHWFHPDWILNQTLEQRLSLQQPEGLFFINQPLNYAKYITYTQDSPKIQAMERRCLALGKALGGIKEREIEALHEKYSSTLRSGWGSATLNDYYGRELVLVSYLQLLFAAVGDASYGSCVSGKDRKAIEIIHTDALQLFKIQHQRWPDFLQEKERQNFIECIIWLYKTRHHAVHSGQNAPGAEGIKTPELYLPADIVSQMSSCKEDDRIASNNEVKAMCKKSKLLGHALWWEKMSAYCHRQMEGLSEENRLVLEGQLKRLVSMEDLFPQTNSWSLFSSGPNHYDFTKAVQDGRLADAFSHAAKYYMPGELATRLTNPMQRIFKAMYQFLDSQEMENLRQNMEYFFSERMAVKGVSSSCSM